MPLYNMTVASKLGKEFFRLLKKNFPPSNNLYKIFNKNCVKLSYRYMHNVVNLIDRSNTKILEIKQQTEPSKSNCINKANCLFKQTCQYEYIVYRVEVHSCEPKNSNVSSNDSKSICRFYTRSFQNKILHS